MTRARPLWLMTLADLALLLLGFLILMHATGERQRAALGAGIRDAFAGTAPPPPTTAMPLDLNGVDGFALGSADLPGDVTAILDWVADAAADPRSRLRITGEADPAEGLALAGLRGAAVARLVERDGRIDAGRLRLDAQLSTGARRVTLSVSYGQ